MFLFAKHSWNWPYFFFKSSLYFRDFAIISYSLYPGMIRVRYLKLIIWLWKSICLKIVNVYSISSPFGKREIKIVQMKGHQQDSLHRKIK